MEEVRGWPRCALTWRFLIDGSIGVHRCSAVANSRSAVHLGLGGVGGAQAGKPVPPEPEKRRGKAETMEEVRGWPCCALTSRFLIDGFIGVHRSSAVANSRSAVHLGLGGVGGAQVADAPKPPWRRRAGKPVPPESEKRRGKAQTMEEVRGWPRCALTSRFLIDVPPVGARHRCVPCRRGVPPPPELRRAGPAPRCTPPTTEAQRTQRGRGAEKGERACDGSRDGPAEGAVAFSE